MYSQLFLALALLICCAFQASLAQSPQVGFCLFQGTTAASNISGFAELRFDVGNKINVTVSLSGIPGADGLHGLHIHQWGDISDAVNASAAGGHYNPSNASHACENVTSRHLGDMGNWQVTGGQLQASKALDLLALQGASSVIGRAIILHSGADDCVTQPTGASGSRLAQCVIGIANPTTRGLSTNIAVAPAAPAITTARCTFQPTADAPSGAGGELWVTAAQSGGLRVTARVVGLSGTHGIHVHTWGELAPLNASLAGSHFNPTNASHALPPTAPRHVGDLGNIQTADSNGNLWYDYNTTADPNVTLAGLIGRAVIIHAGQDHGAGAGCDQSGTSGVRVLMCVLGAANPNTTAPVVPVTVNNNWQNVDCNGTATTPPPTTASSSANLAMLSCLLAMLISMVAIVSI